MKAYTQTSILGDLTAARCGRGAAGVCAAMGGLVLTGWILGIERLTRLSPALPSMKPNSALLMVIASACLWLIVGSTRRRDALSGARRDIAAAVITILASTVALVALSTLAQDLFGVDFGIDELLASAPPASGIAHPSRMSPITAILFAILALAFLVRPATPRSELHVADLLATLAGFGGYLTLIGYAYNAGGLYQLEGFNSIAISAACGFVLLASGFVIGRPHSLVARRVLRRTASGLMLRRLLPATWIVPPAIGWLRLLGQQHGWYGTELGIGLFATSSVGIFVTLLWWTSGSLQESETKRRAAEDKLRAEVSGLDLLNRITRLMAEHKDLDAVYDGVVRALGELFATDLACIAEVTEQSTKVHVRAICHAPGIGDLREALDLAGQRGLACIQEELVYEPGAVEDPRQSVARFAAAGIGSFVIVPLRTHSGMAGVLIVGRHSAEAFSQVDIEFLRQLGDNIALAVEQTQLYSSLKVAYDDLRKTQDALLQRARLRALGEMASGVAHDINNALSPIIVYTESLMKGEPGISQQGKAHLAIMRDAIGEIADTVVRLRDFSRPREAADRRDHIDLNALVMRVVEFTRPRWRDQPIEAGRQVDLLLQLEPRLPHIAGSSSEVNDALTNLIFNAVDALPAGGRITISTRVERTDGVARVVVEVADDGIGMDDATRAQCLEPFFTTKGDRGSGLGLASVFGMVQRLGGQLDIDSAPGQGTAFILRFAALSTSEQPVESEEVPAVPDAAALRILLIDDDPIVLQAMAFQLKGAGHDVTAVEGGQAGVDAFAEAHSRRRPYSVVVTDMGMPSVNGKEVASKVKSLSPATPVVMLTGWGRRMNEDKEAPVGVDRILSKPPRAGELQRVLAELAEGEPADTAVAC